MADKGSFVLYSDCWAQIEKLTIEQRGILLTAVYAHVRDCEKPDMDAAVDMAYSFIAAQIDRDNAKWEKIRQKRVEAGQKGGVASGESRKQTEANEANASLAKQTKQTEANEAVTANASVNAPVPVSVKRESDAIASAPSDTKTTRHKYGGYGWVKLSDAEYSRLLSDHGEATTLFYINLVDEKAQQTGNKNKWKDWNLTVRKAIREKWGGEPQQGKVWKNLD